jgi:hypothetical protein
MKQVLSAAVCFLLVLVYAPTLAQEPAAQAPAAEAPAPLRGPIPVDPRVQIRLHHFAGTGEDIPYAEILAFFAKHSK